MNETKRAGVALVAIVLAVVGCRQTAETHQAASEPETVAPTPTPSAIHAGPAPRTAPSSGYIVGHLKTRDKLITIRTGTDGPLYTVKSEDGTVLAVDLPAEELSAKFPELRGVVEQGIADWAGLDPQYRTIESPIEYVPTQTYGTRTIIIEHNNDLRPAK